MHRNVAQQFQMLVQYNFMWKYELSYTLIEVRLLHQGKEKLADQCWDRNCLLKSHYLEKAAHQFQRRSIDLILEVPKILTSLQKLCKIGIVYDIDI